MENSRRFAGHRLRLARLFSGLTQAELGERIAVTPQHVGQIEHGHKQPTAVLVDAVADVLGFEESFFFGEALDEFRDEECHFRRRKTTPVGVRTRVLAHGSLFASLVAFLDAMEDVVRLPAENVPKLSFASTEDIERAAERCRMEWGLGQDVPIKNLTRAVERAGVVVTRFEASARQIDAFSRAGKRSIVVLNSEKDSHSRSRFDLAHECGHLVGHSGITTGDTETEQQANRFAGALLLPRAGFLREFPRGRSLDWDAIWALKQRWGVSASAIIRRAYELRILPAALYQAGYKHMAYRGWLKHEPGESEPETPELVPLCLTEIGRSRGLSLQEVASILGWRRDKFAAIVGLQIPDPAPPPHAPDGRLISFAAERARRSA